MDWNIAEAKQRLSEVVRAAEHGAQRLCRRGRPVAAVIDIESYARFEEWQASTARRTIGDDLAEVRQLCAEEGYELHVPARSDRPDAWSMPADDAG